MKKICLWCESEEYLNEVELDDVYTNFNEIKIYLCYKCIESTIVASQMECENIIKEFERYLFLVNTV